MLDKAASILLARRSLAAIVFLLSPSLSAALETTPTLDGFRGEYFAKVIQLAEFGDPEMQFELGISYALGLGLPRDMALASQWFKKAAHQGYKPAREALIQISADGESKIPEHLRPDQRSPDELYEWGLKYLKGVGVEEDPSVAIALFKAAAARGHRRAQNMLNLVSK